MVKAVDVFVDDTDILSASAAMQALRVVDDAVAMIGRERAGLGASQNHLGHAMSNMANNSQNTQAARSVIADADYAKEAAELSKNQILQQALSLLGIGKFSSGVSPTSRQLGICLLIALITIDLQYSRKSLQVIDGTATTAAILVIIQHDIFQVIFSRRVSA